ncbi:hypothetical protein MACJ_000105 [Theileria orientalis]|uniref:Uncharacterized protein n=1 Tax=Theileria orientalis TaxID=68886 RepID=A0A976M3I8_THEOR|nr:hypothetical protein MACJ_000105 [Theileria orientalis]
MEHHNETLDVSESTSNPNQSDLNTLNEPYTAVFSDKSKLSASMYDAQSQTSDSSMYEDFGDFDPSNFRLTPHTTISPKREACLSSEFKSVDSFDSFTVLSIADSEEFMDDNDDNKYKLEEDLVVDNSDDENLAVIDTALRDNENRIAIEVYNDKSNLDVSVSHEKKKGDSIEEVFIDLDTNSSEKGNEVTAGNVSFDITTNYNLKEKSMEKLTSLTDSSEGRDSLDSGRIIQYFKHEKVSEVCKRLKEDLIGTREQNPEELPLTDELPFSERVYNYISDLKAYSTISSNEANYSRLSSVDFKALQTTETSDTLGVDEREKDFEKELEPPEHQPSSYVSNEEKDPKKVLKEAEAPNSYESQPEESTEYDRKEDRNKEHEQREDEVIGKDIAYDGEEYDNVIGLDFRANSVPENEIPEDKQEYIQEVDSKGTLKERSFEMDLKSLQYSTKRPLVYQEEGSGREMMVEYELDRDQHKKPKQQPQLQQPHQLEQHLEQKNYCEDDKLVYMSKSMGRDNVNYMKNMGMFNRLEKMNDVTGVAYVGFVDSSSGLDYVNRVDGASGLTYEGVIGKKSSVMYGNRGYDMSRVEYNENFNELNRLGRLERPNSFERLNNLEKIASLERINSIEKASFEKFNSFEKLNSLDRLNSIKSVSSLDRFNGLDGLKVIKNPNTLQNINSMQTGDSKSKYSKNERLNSVNEVSYEDKTTTDRLVDENASKLASTRRVVGDECESWEGLDCIPSSYGVNLVYSCLRTVKIAVGDSLHEYDVYTGTKKYMNEFIEMLRRLNALERKLRSEFIALENNDYSLEATRNSYLSLMKENSRLKGLLNYYKNYEKLQRDTIKLKSDNMAVTRSEILSKLNQFQEVSKMAEKNERMLAMEKSLLTVYDQTGFFILPLHNEGLHNFAYVINYNYYTHHVRRVSTVRDKSVTREERYREDGGATKDSYAQRDEKARGELSAEMLEKLKVLESLPYKPRKIEPDLELKVFIYFESCTTSSDQYLLVGSKTSNSSGSEYDIFGGKKRLSNGDNEEVGGTGIRGGMLNGSSRVVGKVIGVGGSGSKRDEFREINVNIDKNMNIDLYTLKNELKLVLYSPIHKDTAYYRFKHDLVVWFNGTLNTMFNEYLEDQSETLQMKEVLKQVVEMTKEFNMRFVYYLKQFAELVKMSTNYSYGSQNDQERNEEQNQQNQQHKHTKTDQFEECNGNNTVGKHRYGEEYTEYGMSSVGRLNGDTNKNRVLKLMLTFKDNMPCLWCNITFNFNHKYTRIQKQSLYNSVTRERGSSKDNLVTSVRFEFVHSLNKLYLTRYKDQLLQLNKLLTRADELNIVDHLLKALSSQRFHI